MGQEFFIESDSLQQAFRKNFPSQGGKGAGQDLSSTTQIIPVVDLTEAAAGVSLREDLQKAFSHDSITTFAVSNTTTTLLNTTGYYRVFAAYNNMSATNATSNADFSLSDGVTSKKIFELNKDSTSGQQMQNQLILDFMVFLGAGDSLTCTTGNAEVNFEGNTRQIATFDGTLVNPN